MDDWDRLEGWFHRLTSLPPGGREEALELLSGEDPLLAEEVRALLEARGRTGPLDRLESALVRPGAGSAEADDPSGRRIGPYRVESLVARGGMGDVYRGRDTRLDRPVAIKLLPPWSVRDPAAEERLLAEARAIAGLDHTNVCTLLEADRTPEGRLYLVTPFYEGETLQARLEGGPLAPEEAAEVALQVARGLAAAHHRGVIHRDIKPSNLLLLPDGRVKILDFGVAKLADLTLTRPGETPGTLAYMSPEQAAGREVDARTDLWSLGMVLHEMLTGRRALPGVGEADSGGSGAGWSAPGPGPGGSVEGAQDPLAAVPPLMRALVGRLLQPAPGDRPSSAEEVAEVLAGARPTGGAAGSAPPRSRPGAGRSRVPILVTGAGILAVAAALAVVTPMPRGTSAAGPAIRTLGVLPVEVVDPGAVAGAQEVGAGLHQALIGELSALPEMVVISSESMRSLPREGLDDAELADRVGADALVRPFLYLSTDEARLSVEILLPAAGERRGPWRYDGSRAELLQNGRDAARAVARAVGGSLDPGGGPPTGRLLHPAAQDAWLQGVGMLSRYAASLMEQAEREQRIREAIALLEEAVRLEPDWAAAHAQLAGAYHWLASGFNQRFGAEYFPLSRQAAERALLLDPDEPQALASLAFVLFVHWREWEPAEAAIRRSLEINSQNQWLHALLLMTAGRWEESVAAFERARAIDPLSTVLRSQAAFAQGMAGNPEEAIRRLEALLPEVAPEQVLATLESRAYLARYYSVVGRHAEAVAVMERVAELSDSLPAAVGDLGYARFRQGDLEGAESDLAWLEARGEEHRGLALLAALRDPGRAVEALERRIREDPGYLSIMLTTKEYPLLRDHPRVREIVREAGFPDVEAGGPAG